MAAGGDGVAEDVAFHAAIAQAAGTPYLLATLAYLNQFLLDATRVTRANEATRVDLAEDVRRRADRRQLPQGRPGRRIHRTDRRREGSRQLAIACKIEGWD